ncbi:superoxide dismutase [Armillaria novae-zelandiae]|uniref:Superoxide dismutase [Cu-Zn] n=1 Tax=Armillaria novae-zelandiae TaxID=153914 RepID=A0AA39NSF5_9AGAR|nr:superoxide dismutase [Armillaria novae-zelandiae]
MGDSSFESFSRTDSHRHHHLPARLTRRARPNQRPHPRPRPLRPTGFSRPVHFRTFLHPKSYPPHCPLANSGTSLTDAPPPECTTTPFNTTHGAPTDSVQSRHVGDLGNIQSVGNGVAVLDFRDGIIKLDGPLSIVGRSVVVHTGTDDLGGGGMELSLTTGNAGERAACGVIELTRNG